MPRRVVIAVAGSEPHEFWRAVREAVPSDAAVELLHVVDEAPRRDLELQFLRRPGHRPPPTADPSTLAAEERGSEAILGEAMARLEGHAGEVTARTARGRPEAEIVARAAALPADIVVVASRPRPAGDPAAGAGPHSVGHVARFVIDHAPCPVLVIRPAPPVR